MNYAICKAIALRTKKSRKNGVDMCKLICWKENSMVEKMKHFQI